jgi:hypothetical protein
MMFKIVAACLFALVVFSVSPLAEAADRCTGGPGHLRRECAMELGGYCNPATGRWRLGGGVIKGGARLQECVDRKRAAAHH